MNIDMIQKDKGKNKFILCSSQYILFVTVNPRDFAITGLKRLSFFEIDNFSIFYHFYEISPHKYYFFTDHDKKLGAINNAVNIYDEDKNTINKIATYLSKG
jgi:hypothetical protein